MPRGVVPGSLEDGMRRLAEAPGDGDVILTEDDTNTVEMQEAAEAEEQEAPPSVEQPQRAATAKGEKQGKQAPAAAKTNLDDLPEFRDYKASRDRQYEEMRKRLENIERQRADEMQAKANEQMQQLAARIDDMDDPAQRQQVIDQIASMRAQSFVQQERQWANYVSEQAQAAGLDPKSFDPLKYRGQTGAAEFQRDLASAQITKLQRERDELAKRADPQNLEQAARQVVAKVAHQKGLDAFDTAPAADKGPDSLDRAMDDLNQGRVSWATYQRRVKALSGE